ncbi:MAG: AMIN domain-containing protein [Sulfurospirillaceae bacterium]|nr:AMIN domain-containing protein [Sulfurospirillaceae bacterium]
MKKLALFLFLSIVCIARDNPFQPIENIQEATSTKVKEDNFKNASFKLPDSARILKNIEVSYQNIDGSIEKKSIKIDKKIDWHNSFELGIKSNEMQITQQNITPAKEMPTKVSTYKFKNFVSFEVKGKSLKVITKDKLIRDFLVSKPYKVVLDFRRDTNFLTKTFKTNSIPFVSIVLGNHNDYYRVAIELDGQYDYKMKREKGDFIITLR